jgi:hypothetical protein
MWDTYMMPNYYYDPDIHAVLTSGFATPPDLDQGEVDRLNEFLRCDQELERVYDASHPERRPPMPILEAVATTAIAAYDQRSDFLPAGWQKLLVLRAGIAGCKWNLDSADIEEWAYTRITEENPDWAGPHDGEIDSEPPLCWLRRVLAPEVLPIRAMKAREGRKFGLLRP